MFIHRIFRVTRVHNSIIYVVRKVDELFRDSIVTFSLVRPSVQCIENTASTVQTWCNMLDIYMRSYTHTKFISRHKFHCALPITTFSAFRLFLFFSSDFNFLIFASPVFLFWSPDLNFPDSRVYGVISHINLRSWIKLFWNFSRNDFQYEFYTVVLPMIHLCRLCAVNMPLKYAVFTLKKKKNLSKLIWYLLILKLSVKKKISNEKIGLNRFSDAS